MKVLITGSSGYIGGVLAKICSEQGHFVYGIDNNYTDPKIPSYVDHFIGGSYEDVPHNIGEIDVIFHLAALSLLGPSVTIPLQYFENNCSRLETFLTRLARKSWKGLIINASSAAVYGEIKQKLPAVETYTLQPINPYGWTKLVGEQILLNANHQHAIPVVNFRFFNVAGSYYDVGQNPTEPHVLTRLMQSLVRGETFCINGNDYDTWDNTTIRDFVHVEDVCRAMLICAARYMINKEKQNDPIYQTFNLGTGVGTSLKELVERTERITRKHVEVEHGPRRVGDPPYLVADGNLFKKRYDFEYLHNINSIIRDAYQWASNSL